MEGIIILLRNNSLLCVFFVLLFLAGGLKARVFPPNRQPRHILALRGHVDVANLYFFNVSIVFRFDKKKDKMAAVYYVKDDCILSKCLSCFLNLARCKSTKRRVCLFASSIID